MENSERDGNTRPPGLPLESKSESEVAQLLSHVRLFATPWTVAYQDPLSMGFSGQGCWSGLPFPSPGDLPDPEIKAGSPTLQADALPSEPPGKPNLPLEKPICRSGATVRTGHGTTDWFQIGKEVRQGCILSPCLFNLYAEQEPWRHTNY